MPQAGQHAQQAQVLQCAQCDASVQVNKGDTIPVCPNGHTNYV